MLNKVNMYHSLLSTSINIGLLNPNEIIDDLKEIKDQVPINSFEGFKTITENIKDIILC